MDWKTPYWSSLTVAATLIAAGVAQPLYLAGGGFVLVVSLIIVVVARRRSKRFPDVRKAGTAGAPTPQRKGIVFGGGSGHSVSNVRISGYDVGIEVDKAKDVTIRKTKID